MLDEIEKRIAIEFLEELGDYQSSSGSNDYEWPDYISLEKRRQIIDDINNCLPLEDHLPHDTVSTYDFIILDYIIRKFKED